jgi:hypothetical protein
VILDLQGTNTLQSTFVGSILPLFYTCGIIAGSLTITGSGTLFAEGGTLTTATSFLESAGIAAEDFTLEQGAVTAAGGDGGEFSSGVNSGAITINGGTLFATGGTADTESDGLFCVSNSVTITGGTVSAIGGAATSSYGFGVSNLAISGGTLEAAGQTSAIHIPSVTYFANTIPAYAWWSNAAAPVSPGGPETLCTVGPPVYGSPYSYSTADLYVKIVSWPLEYPVIKHYGTWTGTGSAQGIVDGPFGEFVRLTLNGNVVNPTNYTKVDGSTVITLTEAYLKTLANGAYTYRAEFTYGYADLNLVVNVQSNLGPNPKPIPATGDDAGRLLAVGSLTLLLSGLLLAIQARQRRRQKNYDGL